jgi:adenosine deaminase
MSPTLDRDRLLALVRSMPKAELHLHVEGSLEPELIFELAARNGVPLAHPSVEALRAAYAFRDLQSFLGLYYAGASVLCTEDDFHAMAIAYYRRAAADGVIHAELFFDPQTHTARGVPMGAVIGGLARARDQAAREIGVSSSLILCFLRHLSEAQAFDALRAALPYRDQFIGVGLDSSERGHPPQKFERVFARCRALGLHVVAHAGEEGPPAYIEAALDRLGAERIDHGVTCMRRPALVKRLARARVPLTVCPLSNLRLRVVDTLADHPLPHMLAAGLRVTVNSDDPAYFGGYLNANYEALFTTFPQLGVGDAWRLAANGFQSAFAPESVKRRWRARLVKHFVNALRGRPALRSH